MRILAWSIFLLIFAATARAQVSSAAANTDASPEKGATFYESFFGSANTLGQVYKLDSTAGYNFNPWFGIDAGLPVYFVNPSSNSTMSGFQSGTGIGNAYMDLNLTLNNPLMNYDPQLEVTAPTGNQRLGLTTGRMTYDFNNHLDRSFFRITPFANIGVANTVSDTALFTRPFTTFGEVAHFDGGFKVGVLPFISVGASAYDIAPFGDQKIFSRFSPGRSGTVRISGSGNGRFFQNAHETVGGPDLAKDNGASIWAAAGLGRFIQVQAGYTRSVHYDLNTFSFGIGFDTGRLMNIARGR